MSSDIVEMLKKVFLCDAIITLLSLVVSILFLREYTAALIIGILAAIVNFLLNSVITNYSMKLAWGSIFIVLGSLARVSIAVALAVVLYRGNAFNIIAYITGYSLHYIAVIIGVMLRLRKARKLEREKISQ